MEDKHFSLKARDFVVLNSSVMLGHDPDSSPLLPKSLMEAELSASTVTMEKLLLERLLIRKDLRLRNMQVIKKA